MLLRIFFFLYCEELFATPSALKLLTQNQYLQVYIIHKGTRKKHRILQQLYPNIVSQNKYNSLKIEILRQGIDSLYNIS